MSVDCFGMGEVGVMSLVLLDACRSAPVTAAGYFCPSTRTLALRCGGCLRQVSFLGLSSSKNKYI